jgi:hypothetical protein
MLLLEKNAFTEAADFRRSITKEHNFWILHQVSLVSYI